MSTNHCSSLIKKPLWLFVLFFLITSFDLVADDGYRLWLKYDKIKDQAVLIKYQSFIQSIYTPIAVTPIVQSALDELKQGLSGLTGKNIQIKRARLSNQVILELLPSSTTLLNHPDAYQLKHQGTSIFVRAITDKGLLYGSFALLRHLQTSEPIANMDIRESPKINLRMLNHWDNVNGTIERGYAGSSLWKWYDLPEGLDPRYTDYARANASIGINATSINNVNASARFLSKEYILKVAALAGVFRKYGIKTFLSIRFTSPQYLNGFKTADPLDPAVKQWWKDKANEIYKIIPDFGGFLVKANSEGEPGPQDYNRNHADGANMLAEALAPHHGVVIWRAFVYKANPSNDRASESYSEFKPLDGMFNDNVLVQVKNGPIDFQPREPFHPLFGAMPKTPLMMEFQITQEYLGFATHWVYLANLFKEVLDADTYAKGSGSSVAHVIDGSLDHHSLTGIAGVANTGSDRNWCGHIGNQANWYAFGRLAWNPALNSSTIADEWIKMTLTTNQRAVSTVKFIMMNSHESCVNYMTPLGLHHIMGESIHFGPQPWLAKSGRADWTATYYHRADSLGLGFDRTSRGSNALSLYKPEVQDQWNDQDHIPLKYLLWFHHVAWDKKLTTGNTLWQEMCKRYYTGVNDVDGFIQSWHSIQSYLDPEIYAAIETKLQRQRWEAEWWRDACLLYFQQFSKMEIPASYPKIKRSLEEVKKLTELYQMR
ncbi:MAG: alpha-glucuronidase family glycosyl hydrolase [Saprospiraceae bacterium]